MRTVEIVCSGKHLIIPDALTLCRLRVTFSTLSVLPVCDHMCTE